jgi:hypothetical protein
MKYLLVSLLLFGFLTFAAFAQDSDALPSNYLAGTHVKHMKVPPGGSKKRGNLPTPHGFPLGVDTIVNFTGHYEAQGVFYDGSPHQMWEYSMVGKSPDHGGTTIYNAPVVPVSLDLRNFDGSPRYVRVVNGNVVTCGNPPAPGCQRLFYDVTPFIQPFMDGPVFGFANYSSSPHPTQITDAIQRAEFGNQARADWHTLLAPSVKPAEVMTLIRGNYRFALNSDGSCCLYVLVLDSTFVNELFPPSTPDNSTIIGAAEVSGAITTKDISTFLFPNTYLFNSAGDCCVLGFHSFDFEFGVPSNGNQLRFYIVNYSSWISPGLFGGGFQDVTAHSHEIAEIFNDPFVGFDGIHNVTPFWLSPPGDPKGECADIMEVGDVLEVFPSPTYPVTLNGYTYHPQTEALLPWFEFQQNSSAIDNAYSYPDEALLTSLSAPQPLNCGR